MDEDDEPITINHLVGVKCVLNASVEVELRRNSKKDNRLELCTDGSDHYFLITAITDLSADGGFVLTLSNARGIVVSEKAVIIAESLYNPKKTKGATY